MSEQSISSQIEYYLDLALKFRWLLIIPFCIALVIGMYLAATLPKIYEASAEIHVLPPRVPTDLVRQVVSSDVELRISNISKSILSRYRLQKIIGKFGLFSEPENSGMFLEEMVDALRKKIKVEVNRGRDETNSFTISFQGPEPETVMKVTNGLAQSFIEENLKVREAQIVGTSDFLEAELDTMRKRLEEVEKELREYRRQHMGELPEQLDANLRVLDRLQAQVNALQDRLRNDKARLAVVEKQIAANRQILAEGRETGAVSDNGDVSNLDQLKARLATLKANYTDRHPDVIKLMSRIADLEKQFKSGILNPSDNLQSGNYTDPALRAVSVQVNDQILQREEIKGDIKNITLDITKITRQINEYQQRVARTPAHEQALLTLNRDYNNMREAYNSLLNRKLEAELSVNMEKKQKGEQFSIIDHATLPRTPISPDVKKLFLLSAAAGLGLGAGIIFLLDFLSTSLKQPKDYETELGLPVLATIPKLISPREKKLRRINNILTFFSLMIAAGLAGLFGLLLLKGVDPMLKIARGYAQSLNIPFL